MIHAITCSFVPMSGAGTSTSGPMILISSAVKRRVIDCSSFRDNVAGSQAMPPFAPPSGKPTNEHFHVIHIAKAETSPRLTAG